MKTATIDVYEPFQAKGFAADITYRGWRFTTFTGTDRMDVVSKACIWCYAQGFTMIKFYVPAKG